MLLSSINNKRNNHRYSIQQESKRKKDFRKSRNKQQLNKNNNDLASKSSRSSSLHSLVSTTTFLNRKSIWKLNKMIATTASPNSNQFNNHHHNSNKTFNSFKNNNNNSSSINSSSSSRRSNDFNKKNANINNRFQQKKSNPIQINRNNFAQQQQQQPNFNLNMFQNSELTVNLTNNEPRLVIFNNNPSSQSFNLPNNSNKLINYFNNNKFKPQSQQQHQFQRQLSNSATTNSANLEASNCNFYNKNSIDSYNYKNKNIAAFQGFKQNMTPTNIGTQQQQQQRYSSNRFKYIKSISHSATKNSAPYNTTQYIMFDYSRRRRDEEYPNEQKSFSDEWNMHLAAANKETNNNPIEINDNNASILSVNYNHFSLNNSSKQDNKPEHLGNRQLSLSEHNLETMDQDEVEQMQVVNTLNETLPSPSITATTTIHHMSSSL
jgi:hypothetical protein